MAKIFVCDICGRTDKPAKGVKKCRKVADSKFRKRNKDLFDDRPLMITVPNHEGDDYTVFVDVKIEDSRDTKKIDEFHANKNAIINGFVAKLFQQQNPEMIEDEMMYTEGGVPPNGPQQEMAIGIEFKNPNPKICAYCKREMLKLAMAYGDEDVPTNFLE